MRATLYFWLGVALAFMLAIYTFRNILLPFVLGAAIAYLLDPVADRLTDMRISRLMSTLIILLIFVLALAVVALVLVPLLIDQVSGFAQDFPKYVRAGQTILHDKIGNQFADLVGISRTAFDQKISQALSEATTSMLEVLTSIWTGGQAFVSTLSLVVITPVVAFYLLLDWDRMVAQVDDVLPRAPANEIRGLFGEINSTVSALLRGQLTASVILATYYGVALTLAGISQGLLIGLVTGMATFIPYLGSTLGAVLSLAIALVQFWPSWYVFIAVAVIFVVGQFLEGNVLQPWLIGGRIGIHPVWLMFAILAFGSLLGVLGLLLSVPLAAIFGVLVRYSVRRYMASPLYSGAGREGV